VIMGIVIWLIIIVFVCTGFLYLCFDIAIYAGLLRLSKRKNKLENPSEKIFVSVVVPARNEEFNIGNLLNDLVRQDYQAEFFEVIIVDDDSLDQTSKIVTDFATSHPEFPLILLKSEKPENNTYKKKAIETGVNHSKGQLILSTDADCRLGARWISTYVSFFVQKHPQMILGPVVFSHSNSAFGQMQSLEFLSLIASGAAMAEFNKPIMANAANMAYTRELFFNPNENKTLSGFASGDDIQLLFSAKQSGRHNIHFLFHEDIIVNTSAQKNLHDFFAQRFRWTSKSKAYSDFWVIAIALLILIFNLSILLTAILCIWQPIFGFLAAGLWLMKCIFDLPILFRITKMVNQRKVMLHYIPLQIVYPFYIIIAAIGGLFGKFTWKDRLIRN
jgi:cellulose synthase/poly-beta-1,6-N-acetylglucosamine synthase-like glycosyltransferase